MTKHLNITVYGRVKGVNFRSTAKSRAEALGITGTVKNGDGDFVNIESEGEEANLQKFINWCKSATPQSKVLRVQATEGSLQNFKEFKILEPFL